ncbi:hypothetical protein DH2020_040546 [Rehmannia glutinosa]|uniref:Uncharacterized protein n=1 Tax=Rehmannia glutinosa TaxID=99300 RepID=A0ABR0UTE0_REHGL
MNSVRIRKLIWKKEEIFGEIRARELGIEWEGMEKNLRRLKSLPSSINQAHFGSYNDYVDKFEELKACMLLMNNGDYSEEYFVASFISGLSEELQSFVNMFEPTTLQQTIDLGRKQIQTLEAITRKMKPPVRSFAPNYNSYKKPDIPQFQTNRAPPNPPNKPPVKLLTASEMAARREKGLCYNCDEPFTFGHRCKNRITYMIMTEEEELSYLHTTLDITEAPVPAQPQMEEIQISLNAIAGEDGITTMRLYGESGEHKLHILIDSGSTLSFIQEATARRLGCHLEPAKPLLVRVANGQRMVSSYKATSFQWTMQGHLFTYSLRLLDNEGCDLILGGDWLKACTSIELDYENMTFTVTSKGKRVKIQALTSMAECKLIYGNSLYKLMHEDMLGDIEEIFLHRLDGNFKIAPLEVLDHREVGRRGVKVRQICVRWLNLGPSSQLGKICLLSAQVSVFLILGDKDLFHSGVLS